MCYLEHVCNALRCCYFGKNRLFMIIRVSFVFLEMRWLRTMSGLECFDESTCAISVEVFSEYLIKNSSDDILADRVESVFFF